MGVPHPDVTRFAQILFDEAKRSGIGRPIFEVRILKTRGERTVSGYFDAPDKIAPAIAPRDGSVEAIYITANPVASDCFARAANKLKPHADNCTGDAQIVGREWFLVDIDPKRPSGVSSTEVQHEASRERAFAVRAFLDDMGFPPPIMGDSGNGAHLMYRIDLPNDDDSRNLLERCLKALGKRFDDAVVKVDGTTFNASRIWKLYGTMACKGDNLPEQPHRRAALIDTPSPLGVCSRDILAVLASMAPTVEPPPRKDRGPLSTVEFDLRAWLRDHAPADVQLGEERSREAGAWFRELTPCPWGDHERDRAAFVGQRAGGAIVAGCRHDRCSGKGWSDLRALWQPERPRKASASEPPARTDDDAPPSRRVDLHVVREREPGCDDEPQLADGSTTPIYGQDAVTFLGDEDDVEDDSKDWVVRGLVLRAAPNIFAGMPKSKKTIVALHLCLAVAAGEKTWLGRFPITPGRVLVFSHEDSKRETRRRIWRLARGLGYDPRSLAANLRIADRSEPFHFDKPSEMARLEHTLAEWKPSIVLMDSLSRVHLGDENSKKDMNVVTDAWLTLAAKYDLAIVSIHHLKKNLEEGQSIILQLRGSGDIGAAVRHVVAVKREKDDADRLKIQTDGNAQYQPEPFEVQVNDDNDPAGKPIILLSGVDGPAGPSGAVEAAVMLALASGPQSSRRLREVCKGIPGVRNQMVDEVAERLRGAKRIERMIGNGPWKLI